MTEARFLQIHSLHGYPAVLLNRDDSGLAKRIMYGGHMRTRISSQCLKRHWRMADSADSLLGIEGVTAAIRSRETVTLRVIEPLRNRGHDEDLVAKINEKIQMAVYGDKGDRKSNRQPLLLGEPEIEHLAKEAARLARELSGEPLKEAEEALDEWKKSSNTNMKALREANKLPGGLASALFGRMVTADVEANIDAALHVAHAFTVHAEESESDYFTVVDDLRRLEDDPGADHIGETELTSGLFYGYVVVDRQTLLKNLGEDAKMAGEVCRRLVHLIATVSPGAKLGSTAPYGYASWMLIEAGDRQPRSLGEAFRQPCQQGSPALAEEAVCDFLKRFDESYGAEELRRVMSLSGGVAPGAERLSLPRLAEWAGRTLCEGVT